MTYSAASTQAHFFELLFDGRQVGASHMKITAGALVAA